MEQFNLQDVLDNQLKFQENFGFTKGSKNIKELVELIHTHSHFAVEETFEMLRELPYHKYWADYSDLTGNEIIEKFKLAQKEFIDVFIFLMNVALFLGLDSERIYELYREKQKINIQRQNDPELGYVK